MNIAVASTSVHKIGGINEAAAHVFGNDVSVKGYKAASGVNEQPYGHEETLKGAENRLSHLMTLVGETKYDLLAATEGGIFPVGDKHFCCGWVVLADAEGNMAKAHSTGIEFPSADVEEARRRGFEKATVGSVIAERVEGVDGTDPHAYLTSGFINRTMILRQTTLAALGQLLKISSGLRAHVQK